MSKKILIVLHQETSTPGRVGQKLAARGFALDVRRPRFGDALPQSMAGHAGAVIFGGPMSANDRDDYVRLETEWVGVPLKEQAPLLGICLGAQMIARHMGARVYEHPQGLVEVGYYPVRPTEAGHAFGPWPDKIYQWHREGIDQPAGTELLAEGETFACQAFRQGPCAYALQFHTELTLAMLHRWTVRGAPRLALPGARPRGEHFAERFVHDQANSAWLDRFLDLWLAGDPRT